MINKYYIINNATTREEVYYDDGEYRLSATSRAFHEKHPEESKYKVIDKMTYEEIEHNKIPADCEKYQIGVDSYVLIPSKLKEQLDNDKLIADVADIVKGKECIRVEIVDTVGNFLQSLTVDKKNQGLSKIKKFDWYYQYTYEAGSETDIDGEKYIQIIPYGNENSEIEFLKMYLDEDYILDKIVKKTLISEIDLKADFLPKTVFDEAEKLRNEAIKKEEKAIKEIKNTKPILNLAYPARLLTSFNKWENLNTKHLYPGYSIELNDKPKKDYRQIVLGNGIFDILVNIDSKEKNPVVYADKSLMGVIIGKGGKNIKKASSKYNINIRVKERPNIENITKIVSHKNPRHLDDFLAIALVKNKAPNAILELVTPQQIPQEYLTNEKVALIDVGGEFNPIYFNYDHHQNIYSYPSSVVLVLKDIYKVENFDYEFLATLDYIDRFGYPEAKKKFGLKPSDEMQEKLKIILMADLNDIETCKIIADKIFTDVDNMWKDEALDTILKELYDVLYSNKKLDKALQQIEREKKQFQEKLENATTREINGTKVIISNSSFAPFHKKAFDKLEADVIVERNVMNPNQTSIIKNTAKENSKNIELEKIFDNYPKVFLHGTGFMAVVDVAIDNFNTNDLKNIMPIDIEKKQKKKKINRMKPSL